MTAFLQTGILAFCKSSFNAFIQFRQFVYILNSREMPRLQMHPTRSINCRFQNRLQILFDGKPDEETRAALKSNGFRWSPKNQAWQRQLTRNAEYAARQVLDLIAAPPAPAPEEQAEPAAPQEIAPAEADEADSFPQYSIPGA